MAKAKNTMVSGGNKDNSRKTESIDETLERLKGMSKPEVSNKELLSEHYGVTAEKFEALTKTLRGAYMGSERESDALDKIFPDMDAEQRVRIFAYANVRAQIKMRSSLSELKGEIEESLEGSGIVEAFREFGKRKKMGGF
jgi:hypothetical protein